MSIPLHQHASVPVSATPRAVASRLLADPAGIIGDATADALGGMGNLLDRWGFRSSELPETTATEAKDGGVGSVLLAWTGTEHHTGWPAMEVRLLVVPEPLDGSSRLALWTTRSPDAELATDALERFDRRRAVDVAMQRFLTELARRVGGAGDGLPSAPGASRFDRRPLFVHHAEHVAHDATDVARTLLADPLQLGRDLTDAALEALEAPLRDGRFRSQALPEVHVTVSPPDETGVVRVGWRCDEEASGWPAIELTLAVEAVRDGCRLSAWSHREPHYDTSLNRVDKGARDAVLKGLGPAVVRAAAAVRPGVPARRSTVTAAA